MVNSRSSPRVLYLSPAWAYKSIRSLHIAKALRQIGQVDRIIVHAEREMGEAIKDEGEGFDVSYQLDVVARPKAGLFEKIRAALDPRAPFPHGVGVAGEANERVLHTLQQYDIIWFFKLRTANMFQNAIWPRSVLDIDDLPSGFYTSALESSSGLKNRILHSAQIYSWKKRENRLARRFVALAVCSEADRGRLSVTPPPHVIPNGFERPAVPPVRAPSVPVRIGFIGLFNYFANLEGVQWFVSQCWPLIKKELPEARLRLVGRGSDGPISKMGVDIDGLGWVDDTPAEIATWSSMIIPLHKGGGTRVKIAESFSRKCPIVSTRVGAYGYDVTDGKQLRLADSPEEFAQACVDMVRKPADAREMAERAWTDFVDKWTWDAIAPRVWATAEDCLARSQPRK